MRVIPQGNQKKLAKFLTCSLKYNLAAALVGRSKIDLHLVCLHARHALERAIYFRSL